MRPMFAGTLHHERLGHILSAAHWIAVSACIAACGPADGDIGTLGSADGSIGAPAATFEEQFGGASPGWSTLAPLAGATATSGVDAPGATDGRVARLVFPGRPDYSARDRIGVEYRTELSSQQRFGYGVHRSRVSWGACGSTEEVVQAALGYASDGADDNANGITDEIEIDVQVLCGDPARAYLTVFTDYQVTAGGSVRFRKLSHLVDFASGRYYDTPSDSQDEFTLSGTDGTLAIQDLFQSGVFYEIGFEWHEGSIRFFLDAGTGERTLWLLADPSHVPSKPVQTIYNLWHPDSHWFPRDGQAGYPQQDVVMLVDWFRYYAE